MSWLQRQHTSDDADVISDRWQMAEGAKIFVRSSAPYRVNNMLHQHLLLRTMPSNTQTEVYSGYPAPHKTSSQHTLNRVPVGLLATNMKRKCNLHKSKAEEGANETAVMPCLSTKSNNSERFVLPQKKISTTRCLHGCSCTPPRQGSINSFQQERTAQNKI